MKIVRYTSDLLPIWNQIVADSKNGTFLFDRRFMDYHQARFTDCSILFLKGDKPVACLPANYSEQDSTIYSHQGLTYGGLLLSRKTSCDDVLEMFSLLKDYYKRKFGATRFVYKPTPYIYHTYPSEEPLYALFRQNARLIARGISSCIPLGKSLPIKESRKSGIRKAEALGLKISESTDASDILAFWQILDQCLDTNHQVHPVHTPEEMQLLMERFPSRIKLFLAKDAEDKILAGTWLFDCGTVVHTQYMAASPEGKQVGALDYLIALLLLSIEEHPYFDFGISTEAAGTILNSGLIFQKEGFGARGICYDTYLFNL